MKKLILSAVVLLTTLSAGAQEYCLHEVSLSYGAVTPTSIYGAAQWILAKIIAGITSEDFSSSNTGSLSAEYYYRLSELVSVGGVFTFHHWTATVDDITSATTAYTLMPAIKLSWYNREWFSAYSKFGLGASVLKVRGQEKLSFMPNGQISLLGLEVGQSIRFFTEFGFGEQGLVLGGLRYRF